MAIIFKVVGALAVVLGLEETELFIHSEHDIVSLFSLLRHDGQKKPRRLSESWPPSNEENKHTHIVKKIKVNK